MQIKNKKMEFSNNQTEKLQQIKDLGKLQQLQTKCEKFKQNVELLKREISKILSERKQYMERLKSLQEDLEKATEEEHDWQRKLEEANKEFVYDNNDNLQSICLLLGYEVAKWKLLENKGHEITLSYRDICYVTYREISQIFYLVEICPQHYNFTHIKEFLHSSQDLRGLLSSLRKFFDFALECKHNQEMKNNSL